MWSTIIGGIVSEISKLSDIGFDAFADEKNWIWDKKNWTENTGGSILQSLLDPGKAFVDFGIQDSDDNGDIENLYSETLENYNKKKSYYDKTLKDSSLGKMVNEYNNYNRYKSNYNDYYMNNYAGRNYNSPKYYSL